MADRTSLRALIAEAGGPVELDRLAGGPVGRRTPSTAIRDEVYAAIRRLHDKPAPSAWAVFPEFRWGTGFGTHAEQRIDAWAISLWPSAYRWQGHKLPKRRHTTIAYEIKAGRSDWLRELEDPAKRAVPRLFSDLFYFACPAEIIQVEEVPADCGLIWVTDGAALIMRRAPVGYKAQPGWNLIASLARRVQDMER